MKYEEHRAKIKESGLGEDDYIIGIDLGTTHSVISFWNKNKKDAEAIDMSNGFGKIPMPSVVQFRKEELDEEWIVGDEALNSSVIYPETTIQSIKTKMGSEEKIVIGTVEYQPEEISAMILKALLNQIKSSNPKSQCIGAVVSVPYDFDDAAKKATIRACHLAGLNEELIGLIEEPKAAALAYNLNHPFKTNEVLMVFDFGGGTLDITIFKVQSIDEKSQTFKVLSEGGEAKHGGDIIDRLLYDHFLGELEKRGVTSEQLTPENRSELMMRSKETKERLSGAAKVRVPFSFCNPPFVLNFTRVEFEHIIESFAEKTKNLIYRSLKDAYQGAIRPEDVDRILLEGGSSQMPWVRELMTSIFNDQSKIYLSEKPALDISLGATLYAAMKMGIHEQKDVLTGSALVNFELCVPHDIGFEVEVDNKKTFFSMISRGTPYQLAKRSQIFTLTGEQEADMTSISVRILERIHKEKGVDGCSLIGDIHITGLPSRPLGETQIKIELGIDEASGTVNGEVEDLGYKDIHRASGFKETFIPLRHQKTVIVDER